MCKSRIGWQLYIFWMWFRVQKRCCIGTFAQQFLRHKTLFQLYFLQLPHLISAHSCLGQRRNSSIPISASSRGTAERRGLWLCRGFPPTWQHHLDPDGAGITWCIEVYLQKWKHRTPVSVWSESGSLQQHRRGAVQPSCQSVLCRRRWVCSLVPCENRNKVDHINSRDVLLIANMYNSWTILFRALWGTIKSLGPRFVSLWDRGVLGTNSPRGQQGEDHRIWGMKKKSWNNSATRNIQTRSRH